MQGCRTQVFAALIAVFQTGQAVAQEFEMRFGGLRLGTLTVDLTQTATPIAQRSASAPRALPGPRARSVLPGLHRGNPTIGRARQAMTKPPTRGGASRPRVWSGRARPPASNIIPLTRLKPQHPPPT